MNPLDTIDIDALEMKQQEVSADERTRSSITMAAQRPNADMNAKVIDLSTKTGLPKDVVERNLPSIESKMAVESLDIDSIMNETPAAKPWLSDPDNASLVSDDFSFLGRVNKTLNDIPKAFEGGNEQLRLIDLRDRDMFDALADPEKAELEALSESVANAQYGTGGFVSTALTETARNIPTMGAQLLETAKGAAMGAPLGAIGGSAIPVVGTVTGFFGGATAGGIVKGAEESFRQQRALVFDDLMRTRDMNGQPVDRDVARGAAIVAGALNGGLDLFGLGKIAEVIPAVSMAKEKLLQSVSREGIRKAVQMAGYKEAFKRIGVRFAKGVNAEGWTEAAQEISTIAAEEFSKAQSDGAFDDVTATEMLQRPLEAYAMGAAVAGTIGTPIGIASVPFEMRAAGKYTPDEVAAHIESINKEASQSKLYQRSPQRFHDLVKQLSGDSKLYINAEVMTATVEQLEPQQREALLSAMPELQLELETAAASGADISINKADYTAFIAPNPQAAVLKDYIKIDPADMSVAERQQYQTFLANNPALIDTLRSASGEALPAAPQETRGAVKRIVKKAMVQAGRSAQEADYAGEFFGRTLSRFATPFGINAVEFMSQNLLQIETINKDGEAIKSGSNVNALLDDLESVRAGKRIGVDDQGAAALEEFGRRLDASGMTIEQARSMGAQEAYNRLFSAQNQEGVDAGLTLDQTPQLELPLPMGTEGGMGMEQFMASLSANTDSIQGIAALAAQGAQGDQTALQAINEIAQNNLGFLTKSLENVDINYSSNIGLYGGITEASTGVQINFQSDKKDMVLAALAQFAQNFNQEQVHVRGLPDDTAVNGVYADGSYNSSSYRVALSRPLTPEEVQQVIDDSGLFGVTFNDDFVEYYYVGEPNDQSAADGFQSAASAAITAIANITGDAPIVDTTTQRLWVYGEGGIAYDTISGDVPTPQIGDDPTARLLAERYFGSPIEPARQAQTIEQQQAALQRRIAAEYEALPDTDMGNPIVMRAYQELVREVVNQYRTLPIKVDAWDASKGEPYKNSNEMRADVRKNNHMWFYTTTPESFGPSGVEFSGHPLLEPTEFVTQNGHKMLANDVLRVVHDYFAHGLSPTEFGAKGEEAAWLNHMKTIKSPWARWALTSETRGQNSWVNFNAAVYGMDVAAKDKPFARQKSALLPIEYSLTGDEAVDAPMQQLIASLQPQELNGSLAQRIGVDTLNQEEQIVGEPIAGQPNELGFYSKMYRVLEKKLNNSGTPKQFKEQIESLVKNNEFKAEELFWSGIEDYLSNSTADRITKQDVLSFLETSNVELEEVGETSSGRTIKDFDVGDFRDDGGELMEADDDYLKERAEEDHFDDIYKEKLSENEELDEADRRSDDELREEAMEEATEKATEDYNSDPYNYEYRYYLRDESDLPVTVSIQSRYDGDYWEAEVDGVYEEFSRMGDAVDWIKRELMESHGVNVGDESDGQPKFDEYTGDGGENYSFMRLRLPQGMKGGEYNNDSHYSESDVVMHFRTKERKIIEPDGTKRVLFIEEVQSDIHQAAYKNKLAGGIAYATDIDADGMERITEELAQLRSQQTEAQDAVEDVERQIRTEVISELEAAGFKVVRDSGITSQMAGDITKRITWGQPYESEGQLYVDYSETPKEITKDDLNPIIDKLFKKHIPKHEEVREKARLLTTQRSALESKVQDLKSAPPLAPFSKTWREVALKRLIYKASEMGFDAIGWTTGSQQNKRYNLSRFLRTVRAIKQADGGYRIQAYDANEARAIATAAGVSAHHATVDIPDDKLDAALGADGAASVRRQAPEWTERDMAVIKFDEDIEVGGEKKSGLYDNMLVNEAKKIAKKLDKNIEVQLRDDFKQREGGRDFPAWYMNLPETARTKAKEGFELFQRERGSISFSGANPFDFEGRLQNVIIQFTDRADFSTAAHEFSHWAVAAHRYFADLARQRVAKGDVTPEMMAILDDWELIKKQVGATSDVFTVAQEEKVASLFEGYLREGNAPSEGLRRVFTRFRDWLTKIYRDLTSLGIEMNDEVRGIFDRWLASEDEIAKVQHKNSSMAEMAISLGLDASVASKVADYVNSAMMHAEEKLYRQLTKEQRSRETKGYEREFAAVRKIVAAEYEKKREYNLIAFMRSNGFKFLTGAETDGLPTDILTDDPKQDGVIHPDQVADIYAYDSGRAMLRAVRTVGDFDRSVDLETRKRLRLKFPDMIAEGRISMEALDAIMNDRVVLALDVMIKELGRSATGSVGVSMKQFAKAIAKEQVSRMKMADVNYAFRYEVAREKAMRDALRASRAGDAQAAMVLLQRALVNQMIYSELTDLKALRAKAEQIFKRLDEKDKNLAPSLDIDFIGAARYVMHKFGLGGENFNIVGWMADVQERDPDTMNDMVALSAIIASPDKPSKELTTAEFKDVYDAVNNIMWIARRSKEFEIADKKFQTDTAVAALIERMSKFDPIKTPEGTQVYGKIKFTQELSHLKALIRRVELWVSSIDGGFGGPFRQFVWNPVSNAASEYRDARAVWRLKLNDILKVHKEHLRENGKIPSGIIKGDGKELIFRDRLELIGFLLHTGNASNIDKLAGGYGITPDNLSLQIQAMQADARITKQDYVIVQALWDYAEDLKPISQRAHKKLYGYRFEEIEALPIQTRFGVYRGGYWPAVVDRDQTDSKSIEATAQQQFQFMLATTGKGFTKSRVAAYKRPLSTDLRLATQHVDQVLRFAYLEPAVRQVARILNREEVKDGLKSIDAGAYSSMLMPWLQRSAQQALTEPVTSRGRANVGKAARFLRTSASAQTMMGNIANAVQNLTNFPIVIYRVGSRPWAKSMLQYMSNPSAVATKVRTKSTMMLARQNVLDIDVSNEINEIVMRGGYFGKVRNAASRHGYIFQRIVQNFIDHVTWMASYNSYVEQGKDESEAIAFADSIVRETQSSSAPEDISAIEASSEWAKPFLMFYSYFNTMSNNMITESNSIVRELGWKGAPRLFYMYMMIVAIPAVLGDLMVKALRDDLPDDDDEDGEVIDDYLAYVAGSQGRFLAAMAPFVGQPFNALMNSFNEKPFDDRISASPIIQNVETTLRFVSKSAQGDYQDDSQMVRDGLTAIGFMTGLPLGQLGKPLGYIANVNEGDEPADSAVDVGRGLVGGPSPNR